MTNQTFQQFKRLFLTALLCGTLIAPAGAVAVKETAPDFTLKTKSGKNLRLNDFRGKVVMINFWATWCAPCRQELPHMEALYKKYKDRGFVLLGVNIDNDSVAAKKMAEEFKLTFPVLYDEKQQTSKLYKLKAMPSTFIVDRGGKVHEVHLGYKPGYEKSYDKTIGKLVK